MKTSEGAHDKYMFFDIICFICAVWLFGFIIPGITRNQPSVLKIIIWTVIIIVTIGVVILRYIIAKKDYEKDGQKD